MDRRKKALQALREGRGGRLDDYEVPDEQDIYEVVEEDEYQRLVEARRQREDFVVDDDGLGYYDDGEERFGDEDEDDSNRKRQSSSKASNNLSTAALNKARKLRQAASKGQEEAQPTNTSSMWNFVQRGATSARHQQPKSQINAVKRQLDSLLEELDHPIKSQKITKQARFSRPASRAKTHTTTSRHGEFGTSDPSMPWEDTYQDDSTRFPLLDEDDYETKEVKHEAQKLCTPEDIVPLCDTEERPTESPPNELVEAPIARRRLGRPKLGTVSAAMKQASQKPDVSVSEMEIPISNPVSLPSIDVSSASFCPDKIDSEPAAPALAASNLEAALEKDKEGSTFIDMYWLDACEVQGDILVFGKIQVEGNYVSCCAKVLGNKRHLFFLPRKDPSGNSIDLMEVHKEVKSVLQPSCIPIKEGSSWAGKVVTRQYAFDDPTIPRAPTKYLKVVYDAKYPVPEPEVCAEGGTSFEKILGAGASTLENFMIKRKLMGPCWIRIRNPMANPTSSSWCKLEMLVTSPKQITRLQLEIPRPPPPIVTVTIKLKTVVNPKTQKSEVVSISAICHKNVQLDTASDESTFNMTQLSLIRPLGSSASELSLPEFPRDLGEHILRSMPQLQKMANERALLSRLLVQIGAWDPDVLVGHNAWGYDIQVLLGRCVDLKISMWSKIGRRRKLGVPQRKDHFSSDWAIMEALHGRLLCDTYLSAKELLRETTYSLTSLADSQLKVKRMDIEPMDIPNWYNSSKTIVQLAQHTLFDTQLVQRLLFKLQILPLTKQLTCVAGNMWSRTLKGNRADRTEYLLLHEFHSLKYLPPEKRRPKKEKNTAKTEKAKYSGGLVLEPKKGYYDSFILLLDFNSLYPSIIQEYNLCFTTMNWANYVGGGDNALPPIPDDSVDCGVLPRVIRNLVERRRNVKKLMKTEKNPDIKEELNIRQTAIKLTANSMYGCLGFSNSRFFAQPIAALVTAMGRETLQRTVDIATNVVGLDVIYGDTDSIMINTRITDPTEFTKVLQLGEKVKQEVNKLYKTLELEIDGTFRAMLLLKKKKYAAVTAEFGPEGKLVFGKETKGLDLVRRDWCIQSKDSGRYVLDQILSGEDKEVVVKNIHEHLETLAEKMRSGVVPLEKFVITRGLSKHPNDYPDAKSQPHVQVAKHMLKNNLPVNTGDHIPYIICEPLEEQKGSNLSPVERARHPDEIRRSDGILKPDVEWYLTQQILPPISRLCEPIDGTSQTLLATKLGLEAKKYSQSLQSRLEIDDEALVDYTPASYLPDEERFKGVQKLQIRCQACHETASFPGVFYTNQAGLLTCGLQCSNRDCPKPHFWGFPSAMECLASISNSVNQLVHRCMQEYYTGTTVCDDPSCGLVTRQISVLGCCLARGCTGKLRVLVSERSLHTQLTYLKSLFDISHAVKKHSDVPKLELLKYLSKQDKICLDELHETANRFLSDSAYNWIEPSLWQRLFVVPTSIKQ